MKIADFIKNWILPLSMLSGVAIYFISKNIPFVAGHREGVLDAVGIVQPSLIFAMLFLSFCKVDFRRMKPKLWHLWLLLFQVVGFVALSIIAMIVPASENYRVLIEAAMICIICPTATASAVIVKKLGGNAENVTTYTILINICTALLVPLFVPLVHNSIGHAFGESVALIMCKVFPLLLLPLLLAFIIKRFFQQIHYRLARYFNLSFYLWTIALALAIAVTTRSIVHTSLSVGLQISIALISLACCAVQFYAGKKIGGIYGDSITAGQALGQKNTVFAIWLGFTFFTPITSIAGGFYSVWHNIANSYQLYKKKADGNQEF